MQPQDRQMGIGGGNDSFFRDISNWGNYKLNELQHNKSKIDTVTPGPGLHRIHKDTHTNKLQFLFQKLIPEQFQDE